MHIGKTNLHFSYYVNGTEIKSSDSVCDLDIAIDFNLSFNSHINRITSKARSGCAVFLRSFICRESVLMMTFFKAYVRPLLEYGCAVWSPTSKTLIFKLENVQRAFTKRVAKLKNISYNDRLISLKLESLQHRRRLSDLLLLFSFFTCQSDINLDHHLMLKQPYMTRGHNLKIVLPHLNFCAIDEQAFSIRIASDRNSLPDAVLSSPCISNFKSKLSKFFRDDHFANV